MNTSPESGAPAVPPTLTKQDLIASALAQATPGAASSPEKAMDLAHERNSKAISTTLLNPSDIDICGFRIRRFTLASATMLKQIGSPLVAGVPLDKVPNILKDVLTMLMLQSIPLKEAVALVEGPRDRLDEAAYEFAERVPISDVNELVTQAMDMIAKATQGAVSAHKPGVSSPGAGPGADENEPGNDSSRLG